MQCFASFRFFLSRSILTSFDFSHYERESKLKTVGDWKGVEFRNRYESGDIMASGDVNVERIKLEVKKELLLSIAGMKKFETKKCRCNKYNITFSNSENAVLKTLMAQLPIYCKYQSNGCQEILMKEDMTNHEQGCVYRPIFCPEINCTQKSTYHGLMEHVTEVHKGLDVIGKTKFIIIKESCVDLKPEKLAPTRISAFDFTFFEVGVITDQFMFCWIYVLGDPDVAKNFYYHVKNQNQQRW